MTIQRIETGARMSKVVIHGDTVYLAGFTANKELAGGVAGKRFSEARDWVAVFAEDGPFRATETGFSRVSLAKAPGR